MTSIRGPRIGKRPLESAARLWAGRALDLRHRSDFPHATSDHRGASALAYRTRPNSKTSASSRAKTKFCSSTDLLGLQQRGPAGAQGGDQTKSWRNHARSQDGGAELFSRSDQGRYRLCARPVDVVTALAIGISLGIGALNGRVIWLFSISPIARHARHLEDGDVHPTRHTNVASVALQSAYLVYMVSAKECGSTAGLLRQSEDKPSRPSSHRQRSTSQDPPGPASGV
jgi:hypothetical protein